MSPASDQSEHVPYRGFTSALHGQTRQRYRSAVPPCLSIYVPVRTDDAPTILARFIDRYVDVDHPGDPRFDSFRRAHITRSPHSGDGAALAELRRDEAARAAFSLYLQALTHYEAIITITEEGDLVLGLGLDDPNNDPDLLRQAAALMTSLIQEFGATSGIAGVELPPPQSTSEWQSAGLVLIRQEGN
jgi:hypothetical protein